MDYLDRSAKKIFSTLNQIIEFVLTPLGKISAFLAFIGLLKGLGVLDIAWTYLKNLLNKFLLALQIPILGLPLILWLVIVVMVGWLEVQRRKINIVAGVFEEDFRHGLSKWEFGGEGWKTEYDDGEQVLSVSESVDGGITKRGFTWADYQFEFDTKVIKEASAWIMRAENRSKYFMIQLSLSDPSNPRLRPHFRVNDLQYPWIALEDSAVNLNDLKLKKEIKTLEWINVRIIVRGTEIDVYLNNEHALHYFLPDPCRFEKQQTISTPDGTKQVLQKDIVVISYPIGSVGFRCAPPHEHSHFRNVKVKPIH